MTQPYHIEDGEWPEQSGTLLVGPDDFECFLGESEDCTWDRDGSEVVTRLNEQHAAIQRLKNKYEATPEPYILTCAKCGSDILDWQPNPKSKS